MTFDDPVECAQAALAAVRQSGRRRVLLSGSLGPDAFQQIVHTLSAHDVQVNDPDPDPLGFEDLLGYVTPDMACVVYQNPSYFGNVRDLTVLTGECRDWQVPLLVLGQTADADAVERHQSLAAMLRRIPGVRVVTDNYTTRFSLFLGEPVDAADVLEYLEQRGVRGCESAALAYPQYPELRPVLIVNAPQDAVAITQGLREALAVVPKLG